MNTEAQADEIGQALSSNEALPSSTRRFVGSLIQNQFSVESGDSLFEEGLLEQARGEVRELIAETPSSGFQVAMTHSALADLEAFSETRPQVIHILTSIPRQLGSPNCYRLSRPTAFVLKERLLRIIFALDGARKCITVMAVANVRIDPLSKIWRYLTQFKGEDLLRSGELYFCRTDLLTSDPYECRLPSKVVEQRKQALESVFPGESETFQAGFEVQRDSTYVCCWTMREHESYLAWKHYCQEKSESAALEDGGFVIQTTYRRMIHFHAKSRASHQVCCRFINYLDHWQDAIPDYRIGEEAFWKANWFSDERELRLAILNPLSWSSSPEWRKPNLPTCQRVPIDLESFVEAIVLNPFASRSSQDKVFKCLADHRPNLASRVRKSVIERKPPLAE